MKKSYLIDVKRNNSAFDISNVQTFRLDKVSKKYKNGFVDALEKFSKKPIFVSEIK